MIDLYSKAQGSEFAHGIKNKFVIICIYEDVARFKYKTTTLIEIIEGTPVIKQSTIDEYNKRT